MKKLICALIGASALVASATTYIQTSSTGTAPWRPVKDSVSQAHLADSARHAPPSAYADSSRVSGLADSAKRAGWAPLDSGRVRGIVSDTATALRTYIGSASTTGNAATATKLATARTIATSGDVTGTPTNFDGTANVTIPTSFANTHLAGINQDLTTSSSPTFASATIGNGIYRAYAGDNPSLGSIYASGVAPGALNYVLAWEPNGNTSFLSGIVASYLCVNGAPVITATSSGASVTGTLTASGNVGIAGTLDLTASLYLRSDANVLNAAGNGWNTWFSRNNGSPIITAAGGFVGNLTGTASNAVYADSSRISGLADSAKRAGWAPLDTGRVRGIVGDTATVLRTYIGSASTTGNAATATKLATARTITTIGDVTGTPTAFDGTANITIPTAFANTHLAGINQDLTTSSSPTFASATIGNGIYRAYAGANPSLGSIYASGVAPGALNYVLAWEPNGNTSFLSGIVASYLCVNGAVVIAATSSGASVTGTLTASGLITANGGISGNLTGTASNASALGGVAADYFVQGINASRTTQLTESGASQSQIFKSGFYDSQQWTDITTTTWFHMIHCAYSNDVGTDNNWSFDIAASFAGSTNNGEHYYVRTIAGGTSLTWRELIHSANYPSFNNFTSGLSTTTLTASGLITANGGIRLGVASATADFTLNAAQSDIMYVAGGHSITLGGDCPGRIFHVVRDAQGGLSIVIPSGTTLYYNGNAYTGSSISVPSNNYTFTCISPNVWGCQ